MTTPFSRPCKISEKLVIGASSSVDIFTTPTELPILDFSTAVPAPVTTTSFRFKAATERPKSDVAFPSTGISTLAELLAKPI